MNKILEFNRLFEKADDLCDRQAYQIALDLINSALSIDTFIPQKRLFEAYLMRANIQIHMKKYAYGIADCREAIKIYPQSSRGFSLKGFAFLKIEQYEDAIKDLDEAIRLDPHSYIDFYNRGLANFSLSDYESAISDCNESIRLNPSYSESFSLRGSSKYNLDKKIEALKDLNIAIQFDSKNSVAFYYRGVLKRKLEIYQDSIEDLTKAIQIDPSVASYFYQRGLAYKSLGQNEKASKDFDASGIIGYKDYLSTAQNTLKFENKFTRLKLLERTIANVVTLIKKKGL